MATYDSSRIPIPTSSMRSFGNVHELEHDLDREAEEQQPQHAEVKRTESAEAALRADDHDERQRDRRHDEDHAHHRTDGRARDAGILRNVYELRSSSEGTVIRVEVDEGQMVAEDDEIALLETENGRVAVVTDVPGVVRELYVEAGYSVTPGTVDRAHRRVLSGSVQ